MWEFSIIHYNCPTDGSFRNTKYFATHELAVQEIHNYKWIRRDCPMGKAKVQIRKVK